MAQTSTLQDLALASAPWPLESKQELITQAPTLKKPAHFGLAGEVIQQLLTVFSQAQPSAPQRYEREVQNILKEAAEKIREKRAYSFFPDWIRATEAYFGKSFPEYVPEFFGAKATLPALLAKTLVVIWILLEKDGKWPVVAQDKNMVRKRIALPEDPGARLDQLFVVGMQLACFMPFLEGEDLDLVPERFAEISQDDPAKRLYVPTPVSSVEQTLEDAYYNQRYYLHPMGAAVKLHHGGDIIGAFLKVKAGIVLGRFHTVKGDVLCLLDLNTGKGTSFVQVLRGGPPDFLVRILASVYHALAVAKEKPSPRRKRAEEIPLAARYPLAEIGERLSISYIPRTVYLGGNKQESSAPRMLGEFRRPRGVHPVRAYSSWRGPISDHQRKLVMEWEEATGLSILSKLPEGKTFVLPYFSPTLEPGEIAQLPLFIKRWIETELVGAGPRVA